MDNFSRCYQLLGESICCCTHTHTNLLLYKCCTHSEDKINTGDNRETDDLLTFCLISLTNTRSVRTALQFLTQQTKTAKDKPKFLKVWGFPL